MSDAELDGRPVSLDELQALALTTYGCFTTLRVEDGRVRGLGLHLERLRRDSLALFGAGVDASSVRELVRRAMPERGAATVRVTVFDPATDLGAPDRANEPRILITRRAAAALPSPPMSARTVAYERDLPEVKGVGLFGVLRHRRAARLEGYDDALFVDASGAVSEGGTWNIGFFDGHDVIWPDARVLPGVTMLLLQRAHPHLIARVTPEDLRGMRAAFATNAAVGVRALNRVDDVELDAGHPVLDALRAAYTGIAAEAV
ncbi:aminotransferase class IV [Streptomyces sp. ICBB 8177]|uniref:aminotransferase class IV n=1 Tax=Streptomyces sp. ICBB 8177 TaxID=563922 RepID=UPI000D679E64|nr:aminotransferase class IV [Streptomyces sp. ICBB 8177]PWI42558.1 aminotransferase [Streptomyces sp. ICBB 8177]